jgi:hypothetical protein
VPRGVRVRGGTCSSARAREKAMGAARTCRAGCAV